MRSKCNWKFKRNKTSNILASTDKVLYNNSINVSFSKYSLLAVHLPLHCLVAFLFSSVAIQQNLFLNAKYSHQTRIYIKEPGVSVGEMWQCWKDHRTLCRGTYLLRAFPHGLSRTSAAEAVVQTCRSTVQQRTVSALSEVVWCPHTQLHTPMYTNCHMKTRNKCHTYSRYDIGIVVFNIPLDML